MSKALSEFTSILNVQSIQTAKAQTRLRICAGSSEPLLLADEISTKNLMCWSIRQNKKIPVFRVTGPYLNLPVKPRIFFRFYGKKYNFMHFER